MPLTIYGTNWCPHCQAAKAELAPFHPKFVDCDKHGAACKKAGVEGFPKIVNGDRSVVGWYNKGQGDNTPSLVTLGLRKA
eukprot:NODE_7022_length_477_cov_243.257009_g2832_i2.p2 GENE.NODE_7022_length_477_cov_243.257009_g2832_i2~~NODE_7022_length_477_cov_243.257009_g2832_i2.p2  ORF type:complete len:80 (-),score=20.13 NODE_7022_length_477_cov_243.257009_g2832_i2:169-408(-)